LIRGKLAIRTAVVADAPTTVDDVTMLGKGNHEIQEIERADGGWLGDMNGIGNAEVVCRDQEFVRKRERSSEMQNDQKPGR